MSSYIAFECVVHPALHKCTIYSFLSMCGSDTPIAYSAMQLELCL